MAFIEVAKTGEIPPGTMKSFSAGIWQVLVINVSGSFYAVSNVCPHRSWNLSQGTLNGPILTCQLDKAKFNVATGKCVAGPKIFLFLREKKVHDLKVFEVKVDQDKVMVNPV